MENFFDPTKLKWDPSLRSSSDRILAVQGPSAQVALASRGDSVNFYITVFTPSSSSTTDEAIKTATERKPNERPYNKLDGIMQRMATEAFLRSVSRLSLRSSNATLDLW